MKSLVIGYGSIGSRHARILTELGCRVAVTSSREVEFTPRYRTIAAAVKDFHPDYVVIASETARHGEDIRALANAEFKGMLLVEKPLLHRAEELPTGGFRTVNVAYNLRFHPLLQRLRELVQREKVISAQAYVGQYLPQWRPGRDYRTGYSADSQAGGGVLRDLSHELDLLNWLFGGWLKLTAIGGHYSHLEINSDDMFALMLTFNRCPAVTLELNYLDRTGRRRLMVNTDERTYEADLVTGRLMIDGEVDNFTVERDHTYRELHRAMMERASSDVCTYDEALDVVGMIVGAEEAARRGEWLAR
jgi:predicted dehydrogenase